MFLLKLWLFLAWLGATTLTWAAPVLTPASQPAPVTKVIRQYALTSANDFPQRDPQTWRLLGSNDGGKTWTTLDIRQGELFSERHQRRVYQLKAQGAFNLYRLQIDRVRDPAAADSVQLAELELLGETESDLDPAPLFADWITAQGENAPWETPIQVFDGQKETKWLDHASQDPRTRASWIQWQYLCQTNLRITNVARLLELRSRASRNYAVRLQGVFAGGVPGTNLLCFLDATGHMEIPFPADAPQLSPGQRIGLEGISQWTNQQVGIGRCHIQALAPAARTQPTHIALEQPLAPNEDLQWVEAEGKLQFCTGPENHLVMELEDNERSLSIQVLHRTPDPSPQLAGARVRVQGICGSLFNSKGERVAGTLWVPSLGAISPLISANAGTNSLQPPLPAPGDTAPLLTRIEQIRRLSPEEIARGPRVKLHGVITELFGTYLQEDTAGVELWLRGKATQHPPGFGAYVELEGKGDWAPGHGPVVRTEQIRSLGKGKLPRPERCSWSQLASGKMVAQWIEIDGVVRSTDGSHLLLTCEGGQLMATIRSAPAQQVKRLVDATVRIRGVCVAATDSRGQVQGIQLLVPSLEFVEVDQVPGDPFSLPTRPIGSLLQVRGPKEFIHRVKIEGVLTFREDRKYFLQDATGGAMAIAQEDIILNSPTGGWSWLFWQSPSSNVLPREQWDLQTGDQLQVVGFPETRGYSPVLTEVLVRKVPRTAAMQPVKATIADITAGGLDSTLVSLEAWLLKQESLGSHQVLELQADQRVFQAFLRARDTTLPALAAGSRVRVTGVCQIEPLPFAELGKRVASFKLLLGSPAALTVLERPPWWTLKRVLVVTGTLVVVLAIAAGWIGILRRQVEERTKQLQQEIEEHKKTEARLAEEKKLVQAEVEERKRIEAEVEKSHKQLLKASRLAGMAEVATSVLHNVGNVLNSTNVLAASIVENIQRSKVPSLGKLAALLGEHRTELGRFMAEDSVGQQLPGYVSRLAVHLAQEQARLLEKIKALTESIHHIKEIVAMQQNYAKVSGVLETISLVEIVEDALRIHTGALARHQIRVVREYGAAPPITVDRHKVLQILFNLLENAKYACDDDTPGEKQVRVQIQSHGEQRIQISVIDNGVGIPPENLPRLFAQEFSTRKGGHGFGLHSSILAAQDMGASLTAHSEGPGKGATFILDIPIRPK